MKAANRAIWTEHRMKGTLREPHRNEIWQLDDETLDFSRRKSWQCFPYDNIFPMAMFSLWQS